MVAEAAPLMRERARAENKNLLDQVRSAKLSALGGHGQLSTQGLPEAQYQNVSVSRAQNSSSYSGSQAMSFGNR
jgi:hypothetical protein